jgi:alpha-ketoglutarate-dependent taurine dioxygenase
LSWVKLRKLATNDKKKLWKNPVTGELHLEVHPCGAEKLHIEPIPATAESPRDPEALYPDGGTINDLAVVRDLLYKLQRPGISPSLVYAHDWKEKDLSVFFLFFFFIISGIIDTTLITWT